MTISLVTRGGAITLDAPPALGQECDTCPAPAQVRLAVDVDGRDVLDELALCGDCLTEALAIHYGRRHVQAGGRLDELRRIPGQATDPTEDPLGLDPLG